MLIRAALVVLATYLTGSWIGGLSVGVLLFVWALLTPDEGPPVLALGLTYQWMQVTIGIFYTALTGQVLDAMVDSDWQRMVLIGLGCVVCLAVSMFYGTHLARGRIAPAPDAPVRAFSSKLLYIAYVASLLLTGVVQELAWQFPAFTQAILAITFSHLALVFLLTRRFTRPEFQWRKLVLLLAIEVAVGFTGYFAGFREPLILASIAMIEAFDRRDSRHWAFAVALALMLGTTSLIWVSVRGQLRQEMDDEVVSASRLERFDRARTVTSGLASQSPADYGDAMAVLIDRLWAIHYPALALDRVPRDVPHTGGQIMSDALVHLVSPRFLFPDKTDLPSDSEMVRRYAGVNVAGAESNTSIAFGYAAESYVDFGLPWLFVPVIIFGFLVGVAYQVWMSVINHRELAIGLCTVVFWLTLYLFERSWVKTLGGTVTLMVYLGGLTYLIDQWLLGRRARQADTGLPDALIDTTPA